jgi:hypothetical protein
MARFPLLSGSPNNNMLTCGKGIFTSIFGSMRSMRRDRYWLSDAAEFPKNGSRIRTGFCTVSAAVSLLTVVLAGCEEPNREVAPPQEAALKIAGTWEGTFDFEKHGTYAADMTITLDPQGRLSGTGHVNYSKCREIRFSGSFEAPNVSLVARAVDVDRDAPPACLEDLVITLAVEKDETGKFYLVGRGDLGDSPLTIDLERSPNP